MRLPNAQRAWVEREKITEYLLSTSSPGGQSKAIFFLQFGFNADSWNEFATALKLQGSTQEVVLTEETDYGTRYYVDGIIETPDGRNPRVRTIWQIDTGTDYPRLITTYPRGR